MKSFAEYLPTMTAREREIVEAFNLATEAWHADDNPKTDWPIELLRSTPPAKEPDSVEARTMKCMTCGEVKHVNAFETADDCPLCFPKLGDGR